MIACTCPDPPALQRVAAEWRPTRWWLDGREIHPTDFARLIGGQFVLERQVTDGRRVIEFHFRSVKGGRR